MDIKCVTEYIEDGRLVKMFTSLTNSEDIESMGFATIQKEVHTPQGVMGQNVPINFPIEADSIEEAYEKYNQCAQVVLNEIKQEASKPQIIRAAEGAVANIKGGRGGNGNFKRR